MDHKLRLRQLKRVRSLETQLNKVIAEMQNARSFPPYILSNLRASSGCLREDVRVLEKELAPYILKKGNHYEFAYSPEYAAKQQEQRESAGKKSKLT